MSMVLESEYHFSIRMKNNHELQRKLTLLDTTLISVGTVIGSGIFLVPTTIALYLRSSLMTLAVWIIGSLISLFGAHYFQLHIKGGQFPAFFALVSGGKPFGPTRALGFGHDCRALGI